MSDDFRRILYFATTLLALLLVAIHGGVQKTTSDGNANQDQLWGKMDLSKVAEGEAAATLRVTGLGAEGKKDLAMVAPFRMARVVGEEPIEELRRLAAPLQGTRIQHINSTRDGGGVAEILNRLVPLCNELGFETT